MHIPSHVIAVRDDLLAVHGDGQHYICEDEYISEADDPQEVRRRALALLSIAVKMAEVEAEKTAREAAKWEREHAVPLARTMFNTFHKFSDNYREGTSVEVWLKNYEDGNFAVKKWVATATAVLKDQADKA